VGGPGGGKRVGETRGGGGEILGPAPRSGGGFDTIKPGGRGTVLGMKHEVQRNLGGSENEDGLQKTEKDRGLGQIASLAGC